MITPEEAKELRRAIKVIRGYVKDDKKDSESFEMIVIRIVTKALE
jgi:hypothetical protein